MEVPLRNLRRLIAIAHTSISFLRYASVSARRHLRPARQSKPQVATLTPFPGALLMTSNGRRCCRVYSRPLFRRPFHARCHPRTETSVPLPCSTLARRLNKEPATPTQATLPVLCISITLLPTGHRRTTGGSTGPSRISDDFILMVTLLGGPTSTPTLHVLTSRPVIVSTLFV